MSDFNPDAVKRPWMNDRTYDFLKWVAQIVLPGLGALYFGLSQIWGLPNGEEVVGTITLIDIFLGLLLGLSTNAYNKSDSRYDGEMELVPDRENDTTNLNFKMSPAALENGKKELAIRVHRHTPVAPTERITDES